VSPFCVRPVEGARVSMPLRWSEVTAKLDPKQFTIKTAVARMEMLGEDPLRPVMTTQPKLAAVLAKLAKRSAK